MKGNPQPHLEQVFQQRLRSAAGSVGNERGTSEDSLPTEDSDYLPYRISHTPEFSLVCIKADGTLRGYEYVHLDSDSEFSPDGQCITLRFVGRSAKEVQIHGRNLRRLFDYIQQHRAIWVREAAQAFADDDEEIVTRIVITPLKDVESTR